MWDSCNLGNPNQIFEIYPKNFSKNLLGDSGNYAKPSNTPNDINIEKPSNDSTIIKWRQGQHHPLTEHTAFLLSNSLDIHGVLLKGTVPPRFLRIS